MNIKEGKTVVSYRGPTEVVGWLEKRADYNGATISAEISSAVRDKMEREREALAAKERAVASAGA